MDIITTTPIFIPTDPPKCPSCGMDEDKKEVCNHCGYEYEKEKFSVLDIVGVILLFIVGLWVLLTLSYWLITGDVTLTSILKQQWCHLTHLKLF